MCKRYFVTIGNSNIINDCYKYFVAINICDFETHENRRNLWHGNISGSIVIFNYSVNAWVYDMKPRTELHIHLILNRTTLQFTVFDKMKAPRKNSIDEPNCFDKTAKTFRFLSYIFN